ncbi:MAG: hypothetical protein CEE40_01585 [Chloroflexi bacterium B3_Chlor]|nr:MAG: hypothetical protein CEE40_01585 [Chloroflexi bacterium B3_Chlor]
MLVSLLHLLAQSTFFVGCLDSPASPPTPTPVPSGPGPSAPTLTPTPSLPVPTSTPTALATEGPTQSYFNATLGISLAYPMEWLVRETEGGVVFGTSQQVIAGGEFMAGAGLAVSVAPLPNAEWQSVEELCASQASVFNSEEMEIGEPQLRNIGGQVGALISLQGIPGLGQTQTKGLVAAAIWDDWAYTFVALSVAREWATHGASLGRMIESVEFTPRERPEYVPDPWEPDDTLSDATEIEMSSAQAHDLHTLGDRDYVRFEATRGHVYTIETANLGQDIDTRIFLYDAEGRLLTHNDDGRGLEEPWASRLRWTAERTDSLYLMVKDVGDDDAGPGTSYEIRVWEEIHFVEDEYEPDGSPDLATLLKPGKPQVHNLHVPGDQDWIRFEARAGNIFVIETFNLGSSVDTVLHLLDEQGNELAWDDDGRAEEEALASRIQWRAQGDTSLYVMIHDSGDDDGGPETEYRVRLLETWP